MCILTKTTGGDKMKILNQRKRKKDEKKQKKVSPSRFELGIAVKRLVNSFVFTKNSFLLQNSKYFKKRI